MSETSSLHPQASKRLYGVYLLRPRVFTTPGEQNRTLPYAVSDDEMKAAVEVAFRRLQESVLTAAGSVGGTARLHAAIKKTLDDLRQRIDGDPAWLDELIRAASADERPPDS